MIFQINWTFRRYFMLINFWVKLPLVPRKLWSPWQQKGSGRQGCPLALYIQLKPPVKSINQTAITACKSHVTKTHINVVGRHQEIKCQMHAVKKYVLEWSSQIVILTCYIFVIFFFLFQTHLWVVWRRFMMSFVFSSDV